MFEIIFLVGLVILIGLAARWIFEKTRIPEIVILLLAGFSLGPLGLINYFSIPAVNPQYFQAIAPVVGAVAIISMVFEAGLRFRLREIKGNVTFAFFSALIQILVCISVLSAILYFLLHWSFFDSVIFASIVGGMSSFAAYSILPLVRATNNIRSTLYLEGTISTIVLGIIAISMMRYAQIASQNPAAELASVVFSLFSVSFFFGLGIAVLGLILIAHFKTKIPSYFLLFALLLVIYSLDFIYLGGIGIISIIVLGLALANAQDFFRFIKRPLLFEVDQSFKVLQREMSIFITTFFFIYLGLIFRPGQLTVANGVFAVLIVAAILVSRIIVILALDRISKNQQHENFLRSVMVQRDILSATLATFVLIYPFSDSFGLELVCLVILFSTLVTTFGVSYYEHKFRFSFLFHKEVKLRDGRTVLIRTFTRDDIGKLRQFFNELVSEGAYIALDHPLSGAEERDLGEETLIKMNRKDMIVWVVEYNNKIVGRVVAEKMKGREQDNVSLSFYIAKEFRGAGLGTLLMRMIIYESVKVFDPHNLYLTVYSKNKKAIQLYQREGFEKIGVLPDWMKHKGKYLDRIYMVFRGRRERGKK